MYTDILTIDREIQSGTPVFKNTRVPVKSLFDYISTGESIETYMEDYPYVSREQIDKVLGLAGRLLLETAMVFGK
ncbi:MAG: DUF433 domain-containing protein [Leptospiraceae bacterium]|nr:DUF433 domain-containing protein [Leptospiraceae bacterium]MCP5500119.1 DUF433 domain-containing protein [Leptospiraceae bacterium]